MKMGEKFEAFCRAALNVAQQHSGVLARDFDIAAFQRRNRRNRNRGQSTLSDWKQRMPLTPIRVFVAS